MRNKAQVSLEFLFIFMIVLVYIMTIVEPAVSIGEASLEDVSRVSQTKLAAEKLANSINELLVISGQAKKTLHILVPEKSTIKCNLADASKPRIDFNASLSEKIAPPTDCPNRLCSGSLSLVSSTVSCQNAFKGKNFFEIEIVKDANGMINVK